jgi:hypothetical protein
MVDDRYQLRSVLSPIWSIRSIVIPGTPHVYPQPVSPMPQPGDPYAQAFIVEPNACWRIVHDRQGQATHCLAEPTYTGRWYSPRNDGTYWRVWSCPAHLDGLTGIREFGRRRAPSGG